MLNIVKNYCMDDFMKKNDKIALNFCYDDIFKIIIKYMENIDILCFRCKGKSNLYITNQQCVFCQNYLCLKCMNHLNESLCNICRKYSCIECILNGSRYKVPEGYFVYHCNNCKRTFCFDCRGANIGGLNIICEVCYINYDFIYCEDCSEYNIKKTHCKCDPPFCKNCKCDCD